MTAIFTPESRGTKLDSGRLELVPSASQNQPTQTTIRSSATGLLPSREEVTVRCSLCCC